MNFKNNSFMTKKKAFTLIELLIVIAIIGILFIVLVSKVDFATDKAKATGVQTDFRSFQVAIESVAKEHAGLATFGWDTGDANGNRIRDSYDKGDTNQNGVQDDGEVFVGSKAYSETWTNVYTLTNPADANDKSAIVALEEAINKNLDPKLHITIADDLTITMANGAQDPWNTEYHGYYITNAKVDKKDRGSIVMYSNGANQEFGSEHSISNGVVTVNVPGNNVYGKDDYSIAVVYTYANGYGEVKTATTGFSNNQEIVGGNNTLVENNPTDNNNVVTDLVCDRFYVDNTYDWWNAYVFYSDLTYEMFSYNTDDQEVSVIPGYCGAYGTYVFNKETNTIILDDYYELIIESNVIKDGETQYILCETTFSPFIGKTLYNEEYDIELMVESEHVVVMGCCNARRYISQYAKCSYYLEFYDDYDSCVNIYDFPCSTCEDIREYYVWLLINPVDNSALFLEPGE